MADIPQYLADALSGRYRIEGELGRGGMATVYRAEDLKYHRPVAIKILGPDVSAVIGPDRFLREIEIAARLTHPHIVALLDSGDAGGQPYYVMPLVAGESLGSRLERERQLPLEDARRIVAEIADALDYAHGQGFVHRDIKPENILLVGGHALLADFGIARALDAAGGEKLTQSGIVLGTPAYMSPEQASGAGPADSRSDVYGLGCVMYEMLAGNPPFTGATAQAIQARHLFDNLPSLRAVRPGLPEEVERAVSQALAKVPADRFPTAGPSRGRLEREATARGSAGPASGKDPGPVASSSLRPAFCSLRSWAEFWHGAEDYSIGGCTLAVSTAPRPTPPGFLPANSGALVTPPISPSPSMIWSTPRSISRV